MPTYYGTAGNDVISGDQGGSADDIIYGYDGNDTLYGLTGDDILWGGNGHDIFYGGSGLNRYVGGLGNDRFNGGEGYDAVDFSAALNAVTVDLNIIGPQETGEGRDTLVGIEELHGSAFDDRLIGDAFGNRLYGGEGTDILLGGDGWDWLYGDSGDTLDGGAGDDLIFFEGLLTGQIIGGDGNRDFLAIDEARFAGEGIDLTVTGIENFYYTRMILHGSEGDDRLDVHSIIDLIPGSDLDFRVFAGAGDDIIDGADGNDDIYGGDGNDVLTSGKNGIYNSSFDILDGGAGIDTVRYDLSEYGITVDLSLTYYQKVSAGVIDDYDSLAGIEIVIGSVFADTLAGDDNANTLVGGNGDDVLRGASGNDLLHGGAGNDRLDGGLGIDTITYEDAAGGITLHLAIASPQNSIGSGMESLYRVENVIGSAFADVLTGSDLSNALTGGGGDDVLNGGFGNDVMTGGDGIDTATYANAAGSVKVSLAVTAAQYTIAAGTDTLSGVENLIGGGYDDQLTGDGGDNILTGNGGNDTLLGGLGNDTLNGGAGIDTTSYAGAATAVTVNLVLATAQDTGGGGVDTLVSIENLTGTSHDDILTGSAQANIIIGGLGNDAIDGVTGNDTIDGGNGNDVLKGGAGDDIVSGGAGYDMITGGAGADLLTSGTGYDIFLYSALTDSAPGASDRITDLTSFDKVDVSAIDANSSVSGNQAFHLVAALTGAAGEFTLSYDGGTGATTAAFDTNGDAIANMTILFTGDVTALSSVFVL